MPSTRLGPDAISRAATARADLSSALALLNERQWSAGEVFAAAAVAVPARQLLEGVHLYEIRSEHLRDAARVDGFFSVKEVRAWRDECRTWETRLAQLDVDPLLRRALWIVAEELRLGNEDARLGVELLDGVH